VRLVASLVLWAGQRNVQVLPIKGPAGGGEKSPPASLTRFLELAVIDDFNATEWVTIKEAAELAGYATTHIYHLVKTGSIKGKRSGRNWLLDRADVLAYAEKMERLGPAKYDPWRTGARQWVQIDLPERKPLEKEWELMSPDEIRGALDYLDDPTTATILAWVLGYKTSVTIATACRQGRIPGAEKRGGIWHIPLEGVCEAIQDRRLRPKRKQS
jgi:excisionase family DNA binding protein